MEKIDKAYLVKYGMGDYEDYFERTVFATSDKDKAEDYIVKFNKILDKLRETYVTPFRESFDVDTISDDEWDRYQRLKDIGYSFVEEVEFR